MEMCFFLYENALLKNKSPVKFALLSINGNVFFI
jgi:hypothetical protein